MKLKVSKFIELNQAITLPMKFVESPEKFVETLRWKMSGGESEQIC
jgi:hypothetical protein